MESKEPAIRSAAALAEELFVRSLPEIDPSESFESVNLDPSGAVSLIDIPSEAAFQSLGSVNLKLPAGSENSACASPGSTDVLLTTPIIASHIDLSRTGLLPRSVLESMDRDPPASLDANVAKK